MKLSKVVLITALLFCSGVVSLKAYTIGAKTSKLKPAQTEYICRKTGETIVIDGKLDESIWRKTPSVKFYGITDGSNPPFLTEGKIVWNDNYLYVGFYFERPDIQCYWPVKQANLTSEQVKKLIAPTCFSRRSETWRRSESLIMITDSFAKIFLDPDGDGSNYLEFHINPANNVFDAWYKQGFTNDKLYDRKLFPDVDWQCPGLLTAVYIDGTLNASHDIDKAWSIETAIPWKALKPFSRGICPPVSGDIWGAHLGRVYRDRANGKNQYWVWPFLEVKNCHLPDRFAKLIFEDKVPKFKRFFAFTAQDSEEYIRKVSEIGVTDICGTPSKRLIALCRKYKTNFYPLITISPSTWKSVFPDKKVPLQEMRTEQKAMKECLSSKILPKSEKQKSGASQPENWQVTEKQKKQIEELQKSNFKLQQSYQWGGEPERKHTKNIFNGEVLICDLLCFHHPLVLAALKKKIKAYMEYEEIAGIAFDAIGYQNYYDCKCPVSLKLYKEYCEKNKLKPTPKVWKKFSFKTLIDFNNALVDYVHQLNPEAKTFNHIWPVYLPEPLYGNRLKIDYCGQTAAWYFYWDPLRIEQYSRKIYAGQKKYWPNANGVAFIGYFDPMKHDMQFPYKSPAKVESELRAILKGGSRMLMVCGLADVIDNPDIAAVFKKFIKNKH